MQATVKYLLTEQAQRAAIAATGQAIARQQTITVDIQPGDLGYCSVNADGSLEVYPNTFWRALAAAGWAHSGGIPGAPALNPDVLGDIRRGLAALEAAYVDACAIASKYVLDTPAVAGRPDSGNEVQVPYTVLPKSAVLSVHPRINNLWDSYGIKPVDLSQTAQDAMAARYAANIQAAIDLFMNTPDQRLPEPSYAGQAITIGQVMVRQADAGYAGLVEEITRRNDADKALKAAKEAEIENSKRACIENWLATSWVAGETGAEIREQYAEGLLSRKELVALIAADALGKLPDAAAYDDDFCNATSCPCGSGEVETLPRQLYGAWRAIKADLPAGYTVEFTRVRECWQGTERANYSDETAGPVMYFARITVPYGPFRFERTVRIGK